MDTSIIENRTSPCVMCGFCCTNTACQYGKWDEDKSACAYLAEPNDIGQRMCDRYEWIKENVEGWEIYPAFGAGCCMAMFNRPRQEIIRRLLEKTPK